MTGKLAREALTVFVAGDERPGVIAYGLTTADGWRETVFPAGAWPNSPTANRLILDGDGWLVNCWEVPLQAWPSGEDFNRAIRQTLEALINGGARVAWIGAEGVPFCDPPALFDPACMSGGVLAWMTDGGDFACPLDPDLPLARASDRELLTLREYAKGLAGA